MKKWIRIFLQTLVLLVVLGSVVIIWNLRSGEDTDRTEEKARPVVTVEPVLKDLDETVSAWGNVRSADQVSILPKVAGTINTMNVGVGKHVAAGEILAEIDREAYRLDFEQAEASRVAVASTWERIDRLYFSGNATRQDWETARASYIAAEAQASAAELRYDWTRVVAPADGVILIRHVNIGSLVAPEAGTPVYTMGSLENLELEVSIPESLYPFFAGESFPEVTLTAESFPEMEIAGAIESVAPWVDPATRCFKVLCSLDSPGGRLRPGMLVAAEFVISRYSGVYTVPVPALTGGKGVWLQDPDRRAVYRELADPVIIGEYLILPSSFSGSTIVLEGQHFLNEGDILSPLGGGPGQ